MHRNSYSFIHQGHIFARADWCCKKQNKKKEKKKTKKNINDNNKTPTLNKTPFSFVFLNTTRAKRSILLINCQLPDVIPH